MYPPHRLAFTRLLVAQENSRCVPLAGTVRNEPTVFGHAGVLVERLFKPHKLAQGGIAISSSLRPVVGYLVDKNRLNTFTPMGCTFLSGKLRHRALNLEAHHVVSQPRGLVDANHRPPENSSISPSSARISFRM